MISLLGFLVLLLALAGLYFNTAYKVKLKQAEANSKRPPNRILGKFLESKWWVTLILSIFIFTLNGAFFWNPAGTITAVQYPWGGDKMISTQGIKAKWWGRVIPISYEISVQDLILKRHRNEDGKYITEELPESKEGIYNRRADKWEFSDAIKAQIGTAIVIEIVTQDEEQFLSMADRNRSESKLIYGRVLPNIDAALKNTCKLMDAQDYISGEASNFDRYFRDQLQNGMYIVEEDKTAPSQGDILGDTTVVRTVGTSTTKQKKFRIKRDSQGNPLRDNKSNSLSQYGIKFVQAQVTEIDWEQSFDERLDKQKNEVALTQLEKQEAERQRYTAQKEIAKAESNKAKRRGELELKQVEETIAAETRSKVAEQDVIAEKKRLEVARLKAQSQKVAADAQAYENQRLVSAGLTPQERAEWDYKTAVGIAREFKELRLPQTYIEGGKNGQGTLLESLIGAEIAKGMLKK